MSLSLNLSFFVSNIGRIKPILWGFYVVRENVCIVLLPSKPLMITVKMAVIVDITSILAVLRFSGCFSLNGIFWT